MNARTDGLQDLCERAIEGRLGPEESARLERLVLDDPDARRFYVEYLHQNASLQWSDAESGPSTALKVAGAASGRARPGRRRWMAWAAVALLAAGAWLISSPRASGVTPIVATLDGGTACKWDGGSLPTEIGTRLPAGRLRLAEGLARLTFADGARVTLEAPADLELVSPRRCILHAGRLVAKVPARAIGFTIETPTAVIEDLGTEFGVNVGGADSADVQVFHGKVDVRHLATRRLEHMTTGQTLRFGAGNVMRFDPLSERPGPDRDDRWPGVDTPGLVQISTATGRGKDAYIRPPVAKNDGPDSLLLVKNTTKDDYCRKAYLGIDLASASGRRVVEARLGLAFAPTGLGYASEVPDATFLLYGLVDESLDGWDEKAIQWDNAPANRPGGVALDPDKVVLLGRFQILQGVLEGIREVSGPPLADFLNRDTNGIVTMILVRETQGSGRSDLVHGFAGKHHPTLPPPTLKLTVAPR